MKTPPKPYLTNPNMLVPYYLMHSYLYYEKAESLIDDHEYDEICKRLASEWTNITHWHKDLIDRQALQAGTGYQIQWSTMPRRIKSAAKALLAQAVGKHVEDKATSKLNQPPPSKEELDFALDNIDRYPDLTANDIIEMKKAHGYS